MKLGAEPTPFPLYLVSIKKSDYQSLFWYRIFFMLIMHDYKEKDKLIIINEFAMVREVGFEPTTYVPVMSRTP